jgi:acetolactate synthase I/III small subunit
MARNTGGVVRRETDLAARRPVKEERSMAGQSDSGRRRHVLSALVQNRPGVLAHVSGMFASRGFNIDSLAVGETEDANLSRITVVVMGDDRHLEQVRKQLEKIVTVVKVHDISSEDYVERDLMLLKVNAPSSVRGEIQALVQIFRGRIVDVSPDLLMIEISGQEKKIEAFIDQVRPYGIRELARTGRIALVRGARPLEGERDDDDAQIAVTAAASAEMELEPEIQGHSEL